MSEPTPPAENPPAGAELNWDQLRSQWEQENLTPAQVAESLKNSRKWETRAKDNHAKLKEAEPILSQWDALQQASKTELERAQEELARWQGEAQKWRTTSVTSRVETIASADFADPTDALAAIADPSKYLGAGGEIDEEAIKADLAAVLERKPHWRKAAQGSSGPRIPAPNPAQGSGVNGKAAVDPAAQFASIIQGQMNRS